ncbi:uncharacterized protein LOC105840427 isoform X2 [Monomorium pharaonis]|nr:uncharacterized protein LOC105840427 isoform X2 [Monomorium pharaonis]
MMLPDEMQPPKTGFNSRNRLKKARSTSSSRLKNFPAEEIKKLHNPPMFSPEPIASLIVQQDPRENGTFYTNGSVKNNNAHGDAISIQPSPHCQQLKPQNVSRIGSQQQVVANHQICQTNPHSESLLTRQIASPERQAHRPFVPNTLQGAVVYDRSPQSSTAIINQPVITQIPSTQITMPQTQESSSNSRAIINQNPHELSVINSQCQKQSVNDQNVSNHRQMFMPIQQQKQATIGQNASVPLNDRAAGNCQNAYHTQFHGPLQQNLHQINQQTQHSAYRQQMLPQTFNQLQSISNQQPHVHNNLQTHCSHYNQQSPVVQVTGHGMTSPQDMTVNQMRSMYNLPTCQHNLAYPVNFQPTWPQNGRWMQITNQNQQHLHQQLPPQWQYYYQTRDANFNQQNFGNQEQSNPSQNQASNKLTGRSVVETHTQQQEKKELHFTSDMIRDQELLVSTMRQQGVPEEVMLRQFNALLNEQKRHLAYITQFQRQEDIPEDVRKIRLARRRTEKDEKPEWMVHITPPRMSYSDIERITMQQRASNEQYLMNAKPLENMNKVVADQQENHQHPHHQPEKKEICSRVLPQQMYVPTNPYQLWQANNWPYRSNHQTLYGHSNCCSCEHHQNMPSNVCRPLKPTFKYAQYPYNVRYNPYFPYPEPQQIVSKEHNRSPLNRTDDQRILMDPANFYQQNRRPVETSSLLKMRMYKEIICPQKRNNGLQDPENIQKMLQALNDPTSKKGLEYLANLTKKKPIVKLNGIQDFNEIPEDMQLRPATETPSQSHKRISANGLENTRNPNNPSSHILRPKRADEPLMMEYPRQRQNVRNYYSMQAEKENGTVATLQNQGAQYGPIPYNQQNMLVAQGCHNINNMILPNGEGAPHRHYYQMQCCHNGQNLQGGQGDVVCTRRPDAPGAMKINRAGGDTDEKSNIEDATKRTSSVQAVQGTNAYGQPEIHETRTIGGITYLARKPEYVLNNHIVSPHKIANDQTRIC